MENRIKLQYLLEELLGYRGVYYQPPETIQIDYSKPVIIYARDNIKNTFANNNVYFQVLKYNITVIDKNPDSEIVTKVSKISSCTFNRHYTLNGLNYDVFELYF